MVGWACNSSDKNIAKGNKYEFLSIMAKYFNDHPKITPVFRLLIFRQSCLTYMGCKVFEADARLPVYYPNSGAWMR
jgi:hypothetical protein